VEPFEKDLIIIGGGLSGLSAGIIAAYSNLDALIIEQGENPGSRDPIDELAYPHALKKVLTDYTSKKDILTPIERRAFWIMTSDGHTAWECVKPASDEASAGYVADRPALDNSLADRFRSLKGDILTGVEVTSLTRNAKGDITGVIIGRTGAEYHAPLTIIAEGPHSPLADHLLGRDSLLENESLFVAKEIFSGANPSPSLRFTGNEESAASIILLGDPLGVGFSWARIIAWKNYLALKIHVPLDSMKSDIGIKPMLESLKTHPSIEPFMRSLEKVRFITSVVPTGGFEAHADLLWGDGFIITGKAARLYHPFDCRMTDYSIVSGIIAGQAAVAAHNKNHPDHPSDYPRLLENSFIIPDRNSMANFMNFMRARQDFASSYPEILFKLIDGIFTMDERCKRDKKKDLDRELRRLASPWDISKDFYNLYKTYG